MCQACNANKKNWSFVNGKRDKIYHHKLYRVYQGKPANVSLCHLCSIDLFMLGENRFLMHNPALAIHMANQSGTFAAS
jgi:hypothetical protein